MSNISDADLQMFRERAKSELASGCDVNRLRWDDIVKSLCKEVASLRKELAASGNAAALREAVKALLAEVGEYIDDGLECIVCRISGKTIRAARASLSEPPRNCESLDAPKDCNDKAIHISDIVHMLNTDSSGDHEWDDEVCSLEFVGEGGGDTWLVHGREGAAWACECEVLKQEGGSDGK